MIDIDYINQESEKFVKSELEQMFRLANQIHFYAIEYKTHRYHDLLNKMNYDELGKKFVSLFFNDCDLTIKNFLILDDKVSVADKVMHLNNQRVTPKLKDKVKQVIKKERAIKSKAKSLVKNRLMSEIIENDLPVKDYFAICFNFDFFDSLNSFIQDYFKEVVNESTSKLNNEDIGIKISQDSNYDKRKPIKRRINI